MFQVIQNIKPEFIFAAHEHKSYAVLTLREDGKLLYYEDMKYNSYKSGVSTWTFQAAKTTNYTVITEIVVPTCSYRMGASDIGYGVIVYGKLNFPYWGKCIRVIVPLPVFYDVNWLARSVYFNYQFLWYAWR